LKALGIEQSFSDIIISEEFGSEKPDERNYLYYHQKYPSSHLYYIGDNTGKDFIVPAKLGWTTICIQDRGMNIHPQQLDRLPVPDYIVSTFKEIEIA
jgi:putative hydrolase of the HAD superfamily